MVSELDKVLKQGQKAARASKKSAEEHQKWLDMLFGLLDPEQQVKVQLQFPDIKLGESNNGKKKSK